MSVKIFTCGMLINLRLKAVDEEAVEPPEDAASG